jgi:hypothetical protein
MSKSNAFETDLLKLVFQNIPIISFSGVTEDHTLPGSTSAGVLIGSLHTANPGESGDRLSFVPTYSGYTAINIARNTSQWDVAGNVVTNLLQLAFPAAIGGSSTITHFSVGIVQSNKILYYGPLSAPLPVSSGVTPIFGPGQLTISED